MKTHAINGSIISQTDAGLPATIGQRCPTLLTEAELDRIAAAGRKPGVSSGFGRCRQQCEN